MFQRQRELRLNLPDQRDSDQFWALHLHPAGDLQVLLSHRHHLVPLRRPGLRDEVRELDVQRVQGQLHAPAGGWRYQRLHSKRRVETAW